MTFELIFTIIIIIVIISIFLYKSYHFIIEAYFRNKEGFINYSTFMDNYLQVVSKNNYFMNYGLWNDTTKNLFDANTALVDFILEKSKIKDKKDLQILDVGCGYGKQDDYICKRIDKSCKITAVDISEEQIIRATNENVNENVFFEKCDAMNIDKKYPHSSYDVILSIESAFHYSDRPNFFRNVNTLLKKNEDSVFVISDISLTKSRMENDMLTKIVLKFFRDFLHIPEQNLITRDQWKEQLSENLEVIEYIDVTNTTFKPYYIHWMKTYIENKGGPSFIGDLLGSFFCTYQPFSYNIAVCKQKNMIETENLDV